MAIIILNRPDVLNAFNDLLSYEQQDALKQVAHYASPPQIHRLHQANAEKCRLGYLG